MATYLVLINNAPQMGFYHKALGDELIRKGHKVIYAFSDPLPIETYNLDLKNDTYFVFSEYFRNNETRPICDEKYLEINLWKTYFSDYDRHIVHYNHEMYGTEYYQRLLTCLVNFFHEIITTHDVKTIFYETISNSFPYVAFEVGKLNNVNYFGYVGSRLVERFEVNLEEFAIEEQFKTEFSSMDLSTISKDEMEEIEKYLKKFDSDSIPLYQPKKSKLSSDYSLAKRYINQEKLTQLKAGWRVYWKERKHGFKYLYQTGNPLKMYFSFMGRQVRRKFKASIGGHYFNAVDYQDKFFLFPLHMKPEASTSVLSRQYCDDLSLITNIAFNLPFGYKLYVKEHGSNYGNQSFEFYKKLKRLPNVKLIHSGENTTQLLQKCKAVITLTSTMGMEALLMKKKIIVFGNVFYAAHPNSIKLHSYEQLFEGLRSIITEESVSQNLDEINRKFIAAYRKITVQGNVDFPLYENYDANRFTSVVVPCLLDTFI